MPGEQGRVRWISKVLLSQEGLRSNRLLLLLAHLGLLFSDRGRDSHHHILVRRGNRLLLGLFRLLLLLAFLVCLVALVCLALLGILDWGSDLRR